MFLEFDIWLIAIFKRKPLHGPHPCQQIILCLLTLYIKKKVNIKRFKNFLFIFVEDIIQHKWENPVRLDKGSRSYIIRQNISSEDVLSFIDMVETVVSTVSRGGKT